jgi:HKD family nuclease
MGAKCVSLVVNFFLYLYEAVFIQRLLEKKEKKLGVSFHCYKDDFLSFTNAWFYDVLDHIDPNELEIKNTTDTKVCLKP